MAGFFRTAVTNVITAVFGIAVGAVFTTHAFPRFPACGEQWMLELPHFDAGVALDPAIHGGGGACH